MLRWERATVGTSKTSWPGVDRFEAELEDGTTIPALAYRELTGKPVKGEQVLLNTNALRRELGTGGEALVVARTEALPEVEEITGHMVKARYTPQQTMVDAIDDPDGEHYDTVRAATDIAGMPVVVAISADCSLVTMPPVPKAEPRPVTCTSATSSIRSTVAMRRAPGCFGGAS